MKNAIAKTEETRKQIIEAAQILFEQFGFEKTSLDDIAKQAHKAKRSIYNHFETKEEILNTLAETEMQQVITELQPMFTEKDEDDPLIRLESYLLRRMETLHKSTTYALYLQNKLRGNENLHSGMNNICEEFDKWEFRNLKRKWDECDALSMNQLKKSISASAWANMLQMVMFGLSASFFAQRNYENYKHAYRLMVTLIIDSVNKSYFSKQ